MNIGTSPSPSSQKKHVQVNSHHALNFTRRWTKTKLLLIISRFRRAYVRPSMQVIDTSEGEPASALSDPTQLISERALLLVRPDRSAEPELGTFGRCYYTTCCMLRQDRRTASRSGVRVKTECECLQPTVSGRPTLRTGISMTLK